MPIPDYSRDDQDSKREGTNLPYAAHTFGTAAAPVHKDPQSGPLGDEQGSLAEPGKITVRSGSGNTYHISPDTMKRWIGNGSWQRKNYSVLKPQSRSPQPTQPSSAKGPGWGERIGRAITDALPVAGGITGGAMMGIPAVVGTGPIGGAAIVAGSALGTGAGYAAKRLLEEHYFGVHKKPSEELRDLGINMGFGALTATPGATMVNIGEHYLDRIAMAKTSDEVGNVLEALYRTAPKGFTSLAMKRTLNEGLKKESQALEETLRGISTTATEEAATATVVPHSSRFATDLASTTDRTMQRIMLSASRSANLKMYNMLKSLGLNPTSQMSVKEMLNLQDIMRREVFENAVTPTSALEKQYLRDMYRDITQQIAKLAPTVPSHLKRMTNVHAALEAISRFQPGRFESSMAMAALHPKTTTFVLGPAATGVMLTAGDELKRLAERHYFYRLIP